MRASSLTERTAPSGSQGKREGGCNDQHGHPRLGEEGGDAEGQFFPGHGPGEGGQFGRSRAFSRRALDVGH